MRIVLLADSHLSPKTPECVHNWHAAHAAAPTLAADFGIHLGDITLDAVSDPSELAFAAALVRSFPLPILCVPGNHDLGSGSGEAPHDEDMRQRYADCFGRDCWFRQHDGWALCGLNAQLFGTGSTEEEAQWDWFDDQLALLEPQEPLALFVHRPLRRMSPDMPVGRYVRPASAMHLLRGPARQHLKLVVSGHVHQALEVVQDGVRHVWMPSLGFVIGDGLQQRVGRKQVGLAVLTLDGPLIDIEFIEPPGVLPHRLEDLAFYRARNAA